MNLQFGPLYLTIHILMDDNSLVTNYLPIGIQVLVALGFVASSILGSWLLGPKFTSKNKLEAFESGLPSVGNARVQFSIKYFLVATLFVLILWSSFSIFLSLGRKLQRICTINGL